MVTRPQNYNHLAIQPRPRILVLPAPGDWGKRDPENEVVSRDVKSTHNGIWENLACNFM